MRLRSVKQLVKVFEKKLPQTEFQNLQIEINQTGADGGKEENWDKNEKNKCVRLSFVSHHINCFAVSQLINILSFVCTFFSSFNLFDKFSLFNLFWVFSVFGRIFAADASEICQQTDAERKPSKCFSWHRVASPRLVSHVASRLRCVALSWVEGGPTRNQLAAAAQPTNCDTNSDRAQRRWLRQRLRQQQQLIRQRELFIFWPAREQSACQANLCALWIDYKVSLIKPFRLVLCRRASKIEELIKWFISFELICFEV